MPEESKKTIVILGGGFGGVRSALTLEKLVRKARLQDKCDIILIDKNRYHTFIPSLYEVASASPGVSEDALYHRVNVLIKDLVKKKHIQFIKAEVSKINIEDKYVEFSDGGGQEFDYLVVALGAETNFYDIPGAREYSLQLKDFVDALRIRRAIKLADEAPKRIVVAGGGTSGVELAAELSGCLKGMNVDITIIEGAKRVLPAFPEKVSRLGTKRLNLLGIGLRLGHYIKGVKGKKIILDNREKIPFDRLFWGAGIKGHQLLDSLALQKEKNGILKSNDCLHPIGKDDNPVEYVYLLGDVGSFYDYKRKPISLTAQKAINDGKKVAYSLLRSLKGFKETKCYPENVRFIIPVGGKWAIAYLHSFTFAGFFAWVLKSLVELRYLLSILPWYKAFYHWMRAMRTFSKND